MNCRYYESLSVSERLFAISNENSNKLFVINERGVIRTLSNSKLTKSRLIEIQYYEYVFNKEKRIFLINEIKRYIQNSDMTYRKKTLNRLLEDIEELKEMDGE